MALSNNLVAYYKFDNGSLTTDTVGSNTLTNVNTVAGSASGKIGYCADFGSANTNKSFITANNMGLAGRVEMTINMWINVATNPTTGQEQWLADFRSTLTNDGYFNLYYSNIGGTTAISCGHGGASVATITGALTTGTWYMVTAVRDVTNSKFYLYLNGGSRAENTIAIDAGGGYNGLRLASRIDGASNIDLKGTMDEVGVWSRALTATEITELYNGGAGNQYPFSGGAVDTSKFFNLF